jgi:hypothetical protein
MGSPVLSAAVSTRLWAGSVAPLSVFLVDIGTACATDFRIDASRRDGLAISTWSEDV